MITLDIINGTLINYYFHCKRQCFLHGNKLNLEDNSEIVQVGKALHKEKTLGKTNTEIEIDNIKIDRMNNEFVIEIKKSDADVEASRWQLIYYLYVLKSKGVYRKGKLEFIENNKNTKRVEIIEITDDVEVELSKHISAINELILSDVIPSKSEKSSCKRCAYFEYCYI